MSLISNRSLLSNEDTVNELEDWSMKIPEDVFHLGQLSYKIKGSYKVRLQKFCCYFITGCG